MKNNFVAKNAHKFNRANVMVDRKKAIKKSGRHEDATWIWWLHEYEKEVILEYYEASDHVGLESYCKSVIHLSSTQYQNLLESLRRGIS